MDMARRRPGRRRNIDLVDVRQCATQAAHEREYVIERHFVDRPGQLVPSYALRLEECVRIDLRVAPVSEQPRDDAEPARFKPGQEFGLALDGSHILAVARKQVDTVWREDRELIPTGRLDFQRDAIEPELRSKALQLGRTEDGGECG